MKKVLIAADEVDKWSQLCEGLKNEWECTTVNLDVFEKFHTIAVYDAVLMLFSFSSSVPCDIGTSE